MSPPEVANVAMWPKVGLRLTRVSVWVRVKVAM